MKNQLLTFLLPFWHKYFGHDATFKGSKARIVQVGADKDVARIVVSIKNTDYFFEGTPDIETYESRGGEDCIMKTWKYGGWETHLN